MNTQHERTAEAMRGVRDSLFAALAFHERADHAGGTCFGGAVSAIGWLAHTVGLSPEHAGAIGREIEAHRAACRGELDGCDHADRTAAVNEALAAVLPPPAPGPGNPAPPTATGLDAHHAGG